jgi:hypothetical protein
MHVQKNGMRLKETVMASSIERDSVYADTFTDGMFIYTVRVERDPDAERAQMRVESHEPAAWFGDASDARNRTGLSGLTGLTGLTVTFALRTDARRAEFSGASDKKRPSMLLAGMLDGQLFLACRASRYHLERASRADSTRSGAWVCRFDQMREGAVKSALAARTRGARLEFAEGARRVRSRIHQRDLVRARDDARVVAFPTGSRVEREELFAHFEGILEHQPQGARRSSERSEDAEICCERHAPLGNELSVGLDSDQGAMGGTVALDTSTGITIGGSLFSHSYMSARGAGVECMNLRQKIESVIGVQGPTGLDLSAARGWFCAIASAMERVDGLRVAAPKLDAIFTYRLEPANVSTRVGMDVLEHARRRGVASLAVVDCHLSTGTYMFGVTGQYQYAPYCALMTLLWQCTGQNAWRLRGSIAVDATHALSISKLNGTSVIPLVTGIERHAVCLVVRVTRDAFGNATKVHLVGRNSYVDAELHSSSRAVAHFSDVEKSLHESPLAKGAQITARWHDAQGAKGRANGAPVSAAAWETQNAEGSCAVHALMLALRIAQDQVSDAPAFFEARLNERCPIEFAAVCAAAMRLTRMGTHAASRDAASRLQYVVDVDVPTLRIGIFGSVRCDGSVLCGIKSLSTRARDGSAGDMASAMSIVEAELQRAAEHARGAVHASFLRMSCGRHWDEIAGAAKSAGYACTRASAHKTYTPEGPGVG